MLEVTQIACVRGSRRLFDNLTFRLEPQQALRVLGENGSGKTSLLRIVAGLAAAESGEIRWSGRRIGELGEDYRRQLAFLGHANGLKDDLTALENLQHALALAGIAATADAIRESLRAQGLEAAAELPVKVLSQGQKRRAALARLQFCAGKPLWVLDEPFAALDATAVSGLAASIADQLRRGGMVMFTTHQEVGLPGVSVRSMQLGAA
ncbi:MAG TPA: cytochrome c biogenesis heme-transporting ATPase CcmA [Burkholderiales bacterium]|nr:cytochrome c biogenesis heme-transporting ATPase CcmA [Burkholderiales bacterium]